MTMRMRVRRRGRRRGGEGREIYSGEIGVIYHEIPRVRKLQCHVNIS